LKISLRSIPHFADEIEMGHCIFYPPVKTDAISCTFNVDGFSPMKAVLRAHGLNQAHFEKCRRFHEGSKLRIICHGDCYERPQVITVSKTGRWGSEPGATKEILTLADCERCVSLCMTHFGFILGAFPASAFRQCLESIQSASGIENLECVVVDIDARFYQRALDVHTQVRWSEIVDP
jgi:hypothetical protein